MGINPITHENFRDMKEINTAKDNNGDVVHLDICSSAAPVTKQPCHICGISTESIEINELAIHLWKLEIVGHIGYSADYWVPLAKKIYAIGYRLPKEIKKNET